MSLSVVAIRRQSCLFYLICSGVLEGRELCINGFILKPYANSHLVVVVHLYRSSALVLGPVYSELSS